MMKSITNKQHNNMQTMLYATNGSLIKEFITRKEYFLEETTERRPAIVNSYGFIAGLIDGFISDGNKRVYIFIILVGN